jgi:hypothetical protein
LPPLHLQKNRGAKIEKEYFSCNTNSFLYTTVAAPLSFFSPKPTASGGREAQRSGAENQTSPGRRPCPVSTLRSGNPAVDFPSRFLLVASRHGARAIVQQYVIGLPPPVPEPNLPACIAASSPRAPLTAAIDPLAHPLWRHRSASPIAAAAHLDDDRPHLDNGTDARPLLEETAASPRLPVDLCFEHTRW